MTPAARAQAVIELLEGVQPALTGSGPAMDVLVRRYFSARRYAGAKDRAAITEDLYDIIRHQAELAWAVQVAHGGNAPGKASWRDLLLAKLAYRDRREVADIETLFTGVGHAPEVLDEGEKQLAARLVAIDKLPPEAAMVECPRWLEPYFRRRFGAAFTSEMASLLGRAPLGLRVNTLRATRQAVMDVLRAEGLEPQPTAFTLDGLILEGNPRLDDLGLLRDGWVEVQDEGSQVAALLVEALPKLQIADLCAGAGGKALAMAAAMENTGQIYAFDNDAKRLANLRERMKRADAHNIQIQRLPNAGDKRDSILYPFLGRMDRVVLDVPCSGSGTWRRSPELRWRLNEDALSSLISTQSALLKEGAQLVKPGGRLVYITCSLLVEENEDRIAAFLAKNPDFRILPYTVAWPEKAGILPETSSNHADCLLLTPASHGTDGFFVAVLERAPDAGDQ